MTNTFRYSMLIVLLAAGGCVSLPSGPSMMALPGSGKSFEQFRADDFECRQFASGQIGGTMPSQAAANSGVTSAAIGTAVGAVAGAAFDGGRGAATGAGAGLLVGALAGSATGSESAYIAQQRYDYGYIQCMYAKGHKVPVSGRFMSSAPAAPAASAPPPPPGSYAPPPPPPGSYAPPPPPR